MPRAQVATGKTWAGIRLAGGRWPVSNSLLTTSWWRGKSVAHTRNPYYPLLATIQLGWRVGKNTWNRETYKCQCLEFSVFKWTARGMPQSFPESFAPHTATVRQSFGIQHIVVEVSKTLHLRRSSFKMAAPSVVICTVSVPNYTPGPIGQVKCCGKQLHVG